MLYFVLFNQLKVFLTSVLWKSVLPFVKTHLFIMPNNYYILLLVDKSGAFFFVFFLWNLHMFKDVCVCVCCPSVPPLTCLPPLARLPIQLRITGLHIIFCSTSESRLFKISVIFLSLCVYPSLSVQLQRAPGVHARDQTVHSPSEVCLMGEELFVMGEGGGK